jgi:DNA-binding beta-propeller fold protein YncE
LKKKILFLYAVFLALIMLAPSLNVTTQSGFGINCVAGISQNSLEITANITLSQTPRCIAVNDETNKIYFGFDAGLIILDGETEKVGAEILLDHSVYNLEINSQINHIYAYGYYGSSNEEKISVIDGTTNLKVGEISTDSKHYIGSFAVNPVTNLVYVGFLTRILGEYDQVQIYNGENLTLIASVNIPGSNLHRYQVGLGVAVNSQTNKIYAAWSGNNTLSMIDGNTRTIIKTVSPSTFFANLMVNSYTGYLYARPGSYNSSASPSVLNGETLEEVTSMDFGLLAIDPVNNFLYVTNLWTFDRLNGTTHDVIDSLEMQLSGIFCSVAVNPMTSKIFINSGYDKQVYVVSVSEPSSSQSSTPSVAPLSSSPSATPSSTLDQTGGLPLSTVVVVIVAVVIFLLIVAVAFRSIKRK